MRISIISLEFLSTFLYFHNTLSARCSLHLQMLSFTIADITLTSPSRCVPSNVASIAVSLPPTKVSWRYSQINCSSEDHEGSWFAVNIFASYFALNSTGFFGDKEKKKHSFCEGDMGRKQGFHLMREKSDGGWEQEIWPEVMSEKEKGREDDLSVEKKRIWFKILRKI